jgi:nucleoside-diphosphate-sugar epimerase
MAAGGRRRSRDATGRKARGEVGERPAPGHRPRRAQVAARPGESRAPRGRAPREAAGGRPRPVREVLDSSPSRYIAKIDRTTGEELTDPIDPAELLVHAHRDDHPIEIAAQFLASRLIRVTGNETLVRRVLRTIDRLGARVGEAAARISGNPDDEERWRRRLGVRHRDTLFRFRETTRLAQKEVQSRVSELREQARTRLAALGRRPRYRILLTGATGFLGGELLAQASRHPHVAEVVAVVRPETVKDRRSGRVLRVLSPRQRGQALLRRLQIKGTAARRFRFVGGDIEKPDLGIGPQDLARLRRTLTHVVHCAASVSFDDTYESSFRTNVLGCRNALAFSRSLQDALRSPFVSHVAIETSYIHGRRRSTIAREDQLSFPPHFYNNYYELTKAMASIETDRALVGESLRVSQLLPSIVIGHARTGKNRGDTKVLNAPINAFGRAKEALETLGGDWADRARGWLVGLIATTFPADRSAELNLVPVDRVAAGVLAALGAPDAIGTRIHIATDNRIRSDAIVQIAREELGVNVRMADPTLTRNLTLPLVKGLLLALGEPKLAGVLERLGSIFGVYGEWGQPVHGVGNDVRILGLPVRRPDTHAAFRMLCRHNRYVQQFGRVRDRGEVARRERLWEEAIDEIEFETGRVVSGMRPQEFCRLMSARLDLRSFERRGARR